MTTLHVETARNDKPGRVRKWRLPIGLIILSLVPAIAGSVRLGQLASGVAVNDDNRRFFDSPAPVVLHIIGAIVFSIAGALQFAPTLRRRGAKWHRAAGRVLVPAGVVVALSGLWMTRFYELPLSDKDLLNGFRYLVGVAMLGCIAVSVRELQARRYRSHGAWMTRAYGLGLGAGTQDLVGITCFS
jgi:uncharacterized membrane protein